MFFHQTEALDALAAALRQNLIRSSAESPLRVWVPACSTGEDAYSIAIWLCERFEEARAPAHLRIFATDSDEGALTAVRRGIYPQSIARQLSDDRLVRFFDHTLRHYRVCAALREKVLAGQHDVLREPPIFSRLDLISCRGLPSDLEPVLVSRLFERLHFSLRDDGYLLFERGTRVVPPESIFEPVSAGWPIYRKRVAQALQDPELETRLPAPLEETLPVIRRGREERLAGRLLSARQTIAVMTTEIELAHEELRESNTERSSLNEELAVLNVELQHRVRELNAVNEDLSNLINAIDIVVVFLDPELRIRRFTASAARLLSLTLDDIGQPLARLGSNLVDAELERQIRQALETGTPSEKDLRMRKRRWYLRRILPHRAGGQVVGVVVAWIDITQIKSLQKEVASIASLEQQRIGQELHDGIQQELTGLGLLAQTLADRLCGEAADDRQLALRITQGIAASAGHVRSLARGLVPMPIPADKFSLALAELARSTRESLGVECTFEEAPVRIRDSATASHLFRIAQEAVRNATRHSNAARISIRLAASEGNLRLEIRDNGVGLPPRNELRRGVGLKLMEHRCSLLGGRFVTESQPGKGTVIRCVVPSDAALPA